MQIKMSARQASMRAASQFIDEKNDPKKTQVILQCDLSPELYPSYLFFLFKNVVNVHFQHEQIIVMPAGGESTLFKQFFPNWLDKDETTGPSKAYTIGSIANVEQIPFDASKLHNNKVMAAQHGMVDDGSGTVKVSL